MPAQRRRPVANGHKQAADDSSAKAVDGSGGFKRRQTSRATKAFAGLAFAIAALSLGNILFPQQVQQLLHHSSFSRQQPTAAAGYQIASHLLSIERDGKIYKPALGIFPKGCKWRDVVPVEQAVDNSSSTSSTLSATSHLFNSSNIKVQYEYWDEQQQQWTSQQPPACRLQGYPDPGPPAPWRFYKGNPRTEVIPSPHHVTYHNLWYNNGRWYALVDSGRQVPSWKFSKNQEITTLHIKDAQKWVNTTKWRVVTGDTLLFDYIFFVHPTAIGHWWEMMGPLYSVLKQGIDFKRPCNQMVLLHLKRTHLMEWVRAVVAVALGVATHQDLPPIWLQDEPAKDNPWQQLAMPLEGVPADEWVLFERTLIIRDLFTGGNRSFTNTEDARTFRAEVYKHYGFPPPAVRRIVPRLITFQRKRANRRIINEDQFLQLLSKYGQVRVVEFNSSTSFAEQLSAMRQTGVFVSAHTSNLANAVFLQPGSAVIELIQRHWTWNKMDESFRDHTSKLGDIHHFAWRANHLNETVYTSERDAARFSNWTKTECLTEDCTEASTRVDIVVDLVAFKALLDSRLPLVFAGKPVAEAAIPWPAAL